MKQPRRISDLINGQPKAELQEIAKKAKELGEDVDRQWTRRVSDKVKQDKPKNGLRYEVDDIIDYYVLEHIFAHYPLKNYSEIIVGIHQYGEFEFFKDLAIYLKYRYTNKMLMIKTYEFFIDLYYK